MRYEWSRRPTLTKQNNPRPAKNDPSIHDKIENERGERENCNQKPQALEPRQYDDRSDTKFERKLSQSVKERKEFRIWGIQQKCPFGLRNHRGRL